MGPSRSEAGPWLVYALGGGLGHVTRAIALARAACRIGQPVRLLTNSPFAAFLPIERELGPGASVRRIDPNLGRDDVAAVVRNEIEQGQFHALVVDTFPRGLGGELTDLLYGLSCPRVLVHRDLVPSYVRWADLRRFASAYDLILLPGEDAPLGDLPKARRTAPWLIRDRNELLDPASARHGLGLDGDDRPAVVVVGCGQADEMESDRILAADLDATLSGSCAVRFVSVAGSSSPDSIALDATTWPLLEVMPGIDLLVGSGGYNTVHEARATATPLVALARPRRYDRQAHRLSSRERACDELNLIHRVREWVGMRSGSIRAVPWYENGVHEAVRRIAECARR